jgi:hypothetical protein
MLARCANAADVGSYLLTGNTRRARAAQADALQITCSQRVFSPTGAYAEDQGNRVVDYATRARDLERRHGTIDEGNRCFASLVTQNTTRHE